MERVLTENYPVPKTTINFINGALAHITQNTRCTIAILPNTNASDSHTNCQLTGEKRQIWLAKKALSTLLTSFNPSPRSQMRDNEPVRRKRSRTPPQTLEDGEIVDVHTNQTSFTH
mgnify:CR=1 FL=1